MVIPSENSVTDGGGSTNNFGNNIQIKNGAIVFPSNTSNVFVPGVSALPEKPVIKTTGATAAELAAAIVYPMISATPPAPTGTVPPVVTGTVPPPVKPSTKATEYYATENVFFNTDPNGVNVDANEFEDQVLQEIGGRELLILERHDMVDGINQAYEPIKNLSRYALEYSSTNIDPYPNTAIDYFLGLIYEINEYIPSTEELLEIGETAVVRFDETNDNIIIHVKDLVDNQFVEVEFVSFDEVISDTMCI
jgi:hypothetical protein